MNARIKWIENACLLAESPSGHAIVVDGAPEIGGRNLGMRPMEMVLLGLGTCSTMDVISILKKSRQQVTDCEIDINAERGDAVPKMYTHIHLCYHISGRDLQENHVKRAVELSMEKYCSVSAMLKQTVNITYEYIIKAEE